MAGVSIGALIVGLTIAAFLAGHGLVRVHAQSPSEPPPPEKPPGLTGGTGAKPTPRRYALVIGVSYYRDTAIPPLRFAAQDAQRMSRFLMGQAGFKAENVTLLTETNATLSNMRRALDVLARSPLPGDLVLIYFAGHGSAEVDAQGRENDGLSKYLVPHDANPGALSSTGLPMDDFSRVFSRLRSVRAVLMLDACWSGARALPRVPLRSGTLSGDFLDRLIRDPGHAILAASEVNQNCLELEEFRGGLFTRYLLVGMDGEADENGDGIVTVRELHRFVEHRVFRDIQQVGGYQRPLLKRSEVEAKGDFPLVEVPPRTR